MSTNKHKDGAKMQRKARKHAARMQAFTFSDGSVMCHAERRTLQRRAVYSRMPEKFYTRPRSLGKFSPRAVYDEVMQRYPVMMDTLHKSEQAETGNLLAIKDNNETLSRMQRDKAPPRIVDPLRSERAKRAAATRKANKAKDRE